VVEGKMNGKKKEYILQNLKTDGKDMKLLSTMIIVTHYEITSKISFIKLYKEKRS